MLLYSQWRALSLPTRIKIATAFGIAKVGPTHVRDNQIESDGYKIEDIESAINVDSLQKYLNSTNTDILVLFNSLVDMIEGRVVPQEEVAALVSELTVINDVVVTPKKRGRPSKKAK